MIVDDEREHCFIEVDETVLSSEFKTPCGTCQIWGAYPPIKDNGKCEFCDRTESEIIRDHGKLKVSQREIEQREHVSYCHVSGYAFVYVSKEEMAFVRKNLKDNPNAIYKYVRRVI